MINRFCFKLVGEGNGGSIFVGVWYEIIWWGDRDYFG